MKANVFIKTLVQFLLISITAESVNLNGVDMNKIFRSRNKTWSLCFVLFVCELLFCLSCLPRVGVNLFCVLFFSLLFYSPVWVLKSLSIPG